MYQEYVTDDQKERHAGLAAETPNLGQDVAPVAPVAPAAAPAAPAAEPIESTQQPAQQEQPIEAELHGEEQITPTKEQEKADFYKKAEDAGFSRLITDLYWNNPNSQDFISDAVADNYTEESIVKAVENKHAQRRVSEATNLAASYSNIHSRFSTFVRGAVGYINEDQARIAYQDGVELKEGIIKALAEDGYVAEYEEDSGKLMLEGENGHWDEMTPEILDTLYAARGEIGGAIMTGMAAGAYIGAFGGPVTATAGAAIGGLVGGVAGSFQDTARNSIILNDEIDAQVALSKMMDAGVADAFFGTLLGVGWRVAGGLTNTVIKYGGHAARFIKDGDTKRSVEVIMKDLNMNYDEAMKLVINTEKAMGVEHGEWGEIKTIFGGTRPMREREQMMHILTQTRKFGEGYQTVAKGGSKQLEWAIKKRAVETRDAAGKLTPGKRPPVEEVAAVLNKHNKDVRAFYKSVIDEGADAINPSGYKFNLDSITSKPAMKEARLHMDDPYQVQRFKNSMDNIKKMTERRDFNDLLYLRKVVSREKDKASETNVQRALGESIKAIESEIARAAMHHMPPAQAKVWLKSWKQAKDEWAEFKELRKNSLFDEIVEQGATPEHIIKTIEGMAPALNNKLAEVMSKLPNSSKAKVEGSVLQMLTARYTVGKEAGIEAVDFPQLAAKLKELPISSPAGKQYVDTIERLGKILQIDVEMGIASGAVKISADQSFLAKSVMARAEMQLVTSIWKVLKLFKTSEDVDRKTAIRILARMVDNPLEVRTVESFIKSFPKDVRPNIRDITGKFKVAFVEAGGQARNPNTKYDESGKFMAKPRPTTKRVKNKPPEPHILTPKEIEEQRRITREKAKERREGYSRPVKNPRNMRRKR